MSHRPHPYQFISGAGVMWRYQVAAAVRGWSHRAVCGSAVVSWRCQPRRRVSGFRPEPSTRPSLQSGGAGQRMCRRPLVTAVARISCRTRNCMGPHADQGQKPKLDDFGFCPWQCKLRKLAVLGCDRLAGSRYANGPGRPLPPERRADLASDRCGYGQWGRYPASGSCSVATTVTPWVVSTLVVINETSSRWTVYVEIDPPQAF